MIIFILFIIIYLCFSISITFGKQPAQIVVDIPPVEEGGSGPKGDVSCVTLSHVPIILIIYIDANNITNLKNIHFSEVATLY